MKELGKGTALCTAALRSGMSETTGRRHRGQALEGSLTSVVAGFPSGELEGRLQNISTTAEDSRGLEGTAGDKKQGQGNVFPRTCDESRAPSAS